MELTKRTAKNAIEEFIGEGKVNIMEVSRADNGNWIVKFKQNNKLTLLDFPNHQEAEDFAFEFGGLNNLTVTAPDSMLFLDQWDIEGIWNDGHEILSVQTAAAKSEDDRETKVPHVLGPECGFSYLPGSKKTKERETISFVEQIKQVDQVSGRTMVFDNVDQPKALIKQLKDKFPSHRFPVESFISRNHESSHLCKWLRRRVGDGTKRMELRLIKLGGEDFTKCRYSQLIIAADGLAATECERVIIKKSAVKTEDHCGISLGV